VLTKAELQRLRSLRDKKRREALGQFVVEGEKVVGELIAAGFPFLEIYTTSDVDRFGVATPNSRKCRPTPPPITRISTAEMARASHFPTPSTVLAVGAVERVPLPPDALAQGFTLALDGIQDAGNVGTILRIADWFGFDRVLLSPDCADLFHQKVINASMGSFARVRVHTVDLANALAVPATGPVKTAVLGCVLEGEDVHSLPSLRQAVVVIGSEGRGISPAVAAHVTRRVTIPRLGRAESLNAAVAAAIVCDNLRRNSKTV
jgi:TrmH family RNA methyltransferase